MVFKVSTKPIEITLDYIEYNDDDNEISHLIVIRNDEQRKIFEGKYKTAKAVFSRPRWETFNYYISGCVEENPINNQRQIDMMKMRINKFGILLEELYDGDGEKVKLDQDFYQNVNPDFAVALVDEFDQKLNEERIKFLKKMGLFDEIEKKEDKTEAKEDKTEDKAKNK
jgi:hypothetical protein